MKNGKKIYLGLDIGTDSVGYAVTDEEYKLQKFHGQDAWGSLIFGAASLSDKRRSFRSSRRRLDRRQQRVQLVAELFSPEIAKVDSRFFIRLSESYKWRDETSDNFVFFNDEDYTDVQYMGQFPTIHHLICDLMQNDKPHDVRLVYLACAWLVAHRGHFLNNIDVDRIDEITDISATYDKFIDYFEDNRFKKPWPEVDLKELSLVLKEKLNITNKKKALCNVLLSGAKPAKQAKEDFPFSEEAIIGLLAGSQVSLKELFFKDEYAELDKISLGMDEEKFLEIMGQIGDDYELINALRGLYEWGILADILGDSSGATISAAKVAVYEQHKKDLASLKYMIRKYLPDKYNAVFREAGEANYVAYSYHVDSKIAQDVKKKASLEDFTKYIQGLFKKLEVDEEDKECLEDINERLASYKFMPKQKNTDNRVIPHQLYEYELKRIIENASSYLPFLNEKDDDGIRVSDKILSVFRFKVPYYVGPLNDGLKKNKKVNNHAWISRKAGKIYPWNFKEMVDEDESETEFIRHMTNKCSYIPGEDVLPKDSLCYQRFMVLNEINNIRIDGEKLPVEVKQALYKDKFEKQKKVTRKEIEDYLISNNLLEKNNTEALSGLDVTVKASLSSHYAFRHLLEDGILTEADVEKIIERASYAEDKGRLTKWLKVNYPQLSEENVKYIARIRIKDFGRLSSAFLQEIDGTDSTDSSTGEITTILRALWETKDNLMELLSDRYTFAETIQSLRQDYYRENGKSLKDRMDEMYISNAVRRPIYRTMAIVKDVEKAFGVPDKIFVEMTRGGNAKLKGKRTKPRKQQIIDYYAKAKEDVRDLKKQLEDMGEYVDNKLQSDRVFLYFMQYGKCAYSGEAIDLQKLMAGSKEYDIDHIYPQAYITDDSIINNKVLVLSKINGAKSNEYPIKAEIRGRMHGIWSMWHDNGTLSDEKYKRLTRSTPFSDEERYGFINRQLTETSQSTKAVTELLKEKYPQVEIVYSKAGLTSEFRHEFGLVKSRLYNDLHHAQDAYLNIVVGNVYDMKFSKKWFSLKDGDYSIKTKTLFSHKLERNNQLVWNPDTMLGMVKKTANKNSAHFVKYATFKTGGLFDQMPVKKGRGQVPIKKGMPIERYGGYNEAGVMFYIPVKYKAGKKNEVIIMPVELLHGQHFLKDAEFAKEYSFDRLQRILKKPVESVEFPMGMRPWKVNTVLEVDGFRVCITGIAGGGKTLIVQPMMQFSSVEKWRSYIKRMGDFVEKRKENANLLYDKEHDVVNGEDNIELYELYIDKLQNTVYRKRYNSPIQILVDGRDKFKELSVVEQCQVLLNIHTVFGRMTGGCDLTAIGGSEHTAATKSFSYKISIWKKKYSDVRIVDQSASGLWETKSDNLLEIL